VNRNIVCIGRLALDSFPTPIRNSKLLFHAVRCVFPWLPLSLLDFRSKAYLYNKEDFALLYTPGSIMYLPSVSSLTDINYFHLRLINKVVNRCAPASILDVGCGTGFLLNYIASDLTETAFSVGIDLASLPMSFPAFPNLNSSSFCFMRGDLYNELIKIPDKSFDCVICAHVIEHVFEPLSLLAELRRVCRNKLIILIPLEKCFRWGINLHVSFFPNASSFLQFVGADYNLVCYSSFIRLGDLMYVETVS